MTPANAGSLYTTECSPFKMTFPGAETVNCMGIMANYDGELKYVVVFLFKIGIYSDLLANVLLCSFRVQFVTPALWPTVRV